MNSLGLRAIGGSATPLPAWNQHGSIRKAQRVQTGANNYFCNNLFNINFSQRKCKH